MVNNKKYNNLKYLSLLKIIKKNNIKKRSENFKKIHNITKIKKSEKSIISTCAISGNLKKIQKKISLNRHFIRTPYLKKMFNIWEKKSW